MRPALQCGMPLQRAPSDLNSRTSGSGHTQAVNGRDAGASLMKPRRAASSAPPRSRWSVQ